MSELNKKAFGGLVLFLVTLGALIFLSAWTLNYWQGWTFLALVTVLTFAVTLYLMKKDPALLARRVSAGPVAEKDTMQRIIQSFATVAFIAVIIFPVLDHRFMWYPAPPSTVYFGDFLVALGFYSIFLVFRENTFTSGTIEVHKDQKVISTGPYATVRHPMYVGGLIFLFGVPLALASYLGLLTFIPISAVIIWRLLEEEKFLRKSLPSYTEYTQKVRYRLIPYIW